MYIIHTLYSLYHMDLTIVGALSSANFIISCSFRWPL